MKAAIVAVIIAAGSVGLGFWANHIGNRPLAGGAFFLTLMAVVAGAILIGTAWFQTMKGFLRSLMK
jgi:hypothetical protein